MEYYSNRQPNLITKVMQSTIDNIAKKGGNSGMTNSTISDKISNYISNFYQKYIQENKVITLCIIVVIAFLIYRYYKKKEQDEKLEKFEDDSRNLINEITSKQTEHLRYQSQPTFNPLFPVDEQKQPVYYPPEPLPINIPDNGVVYTRNLYEDPSPYTPLNNTVYDYDNVYTNPSRSYYTGTYNSYKNAQDTTIRNPLGFANDFNSSDNAFIGPVTDKNKKVMLDYQDILSNQHHDLVDALQIGPKYLDSDSLDYTIEPPYAS
jgi:hypothetical protein